MNIDCDSWSYTMIDSFICLHSLYLWLVEEFILIDVFQNRALNENKVVALRR
jgi:hypothetical protein